MNRDRHILIVDDEPRRHDIIRARIESKAVHPDCLVFHTARTIKDAHRIASGVDDWFMWCLGYDMDAMFDVCPTVTVSGVDCFGLPVTRASTGLDFINEELAKDPDNTPMLIWVHTHNVVGSREMRKALENASKNVVVYPV